MTYSMVFQSPHGRLNYGFMSLDSDVAYFNSTFIKSCNVATSHLKSLVSFQVFKKKFFSFNIAHAWYEFKIKSV